MTLPFQITGDRVSPPSWLSWVRNLLDKLLLRPKDLSLHPLLLLLVMLRLYIRSFITTNAFYTASYILITAMSFAISDAFFLIKESLFLSGITIKLVSLKKWTDSLSIVTVLVYLLVSGYFCWCPVALLRFFERIYFRLISVSYNLFCCILFLIHQNLVQYTRKIRLKDFFHHFLFRLSGCNLWFAPIIFWTDKWIIFRSKNSLIGKK